MATPAQFPCGNVGTRQLQAIDDILTRASAPTYEVGLAHESLRIFILFGERLSG
jgi:hypothetical protein